MKIITPGTPQDPEALPWWVGKEVSCPQCGMRAQLEHDDIEGPVDEMRTHDIQGTWFVLVECPTDYCQGRITLTDLKTNERRQ